jgi:cellulose biosynthesis protein BcsQ
MPVVGFISEKGGVAKTTARYHIAIAFAPRFGVGSGMAGSR